MLWEGSQLWEHLLRVPGLCKALRQHGPGSMFFLLDFLFIWGHTLWFCI